ncbi:Stress responsive A/B Barrel Domain protein [Botrimarina colliarenosi]|uniref:Stress responsive A/B Barrel Domain protein n=1 Tax=Botrimarina colliarenosi TaxID=2528001 RepID=A0A5C6ACF0_9BACT|nr:Dabb family protein [Botrimarina colliarenosi]TWT97086.1 Stress responsive A/B Barrel Domain protein [Botrimarina colliarenosi]
MFKALALVAAILFVSTPYAVAAPQAHMVFFTLTEPNDANRDQLVAACHKYLADHTGVIYFTVGTIAEDRDREVNDTSFQVALHVVFDSPAAHDTYQTHPRHLAFIKEAGPLWSGVKVFDSNLVAASAAAAPSAAAPQEKAAAGE